MTNIVHRGTRLDTLRFAPLAGAAALLAATPALASESFPAMCISRQHFDTACPACGMTRAIGSLVSGDVWGSIVMHPMAIPLVLQTLTFAVIAIVMDRVQALEVTARWLPRLVVVNFVLMTSIWGLRALFGVLPPI